MNTTTCLSSIVTFYRELIDGLMCVEEVESNITDSVFSGSLDEHDYFHQ